MYTDDVVCTLSMRGSIKMKQHQLDHLKENGDIASMNRTFSSRRPHDIDIKMLQAKRQQAEMRRLVHVRGRVLLLKLNEPHDVIL